MSKKVYWLLSAALVISCPFFSGLHADAEDSQEAPGPDTKTPALPEVPFKPFTGKIAKNKVRMRLQPSLDGRILKEMARDDLVMVIGESDEFYAIAPPKGTKAFIFRTYVLDNVIEGNHVNIRLEPDLESPIIAQMNAGERVEGSISPLNSKWMEIKPPQSTRFFICKEYVEKVGEPHVMALMEKRRDEVNALLNSTYLISQSEMHKPFEQVNLDSILVNFNKISKQYSDFPEQTSKAKEILAKVQEDYLHKKIAYLETKAQSGNATIAEVEIPKEIQGQQEKFDQLQKTMKMDDLEPLSMEADDDLLLTAPKTTAHLDFSHIFDPAGMTDKMAAWIPNEKTLFDEQTARDGKNDPRNYYEHQNEEALVLRGLLEPYQRSVKNKPGDFVLINKMTNLPIAYLYSTRVNLQDLVGQEITLRASPRTNNHFAFPAYYVIAVE